MFCGQACSRYCMMEKQDQMLKISLNYEKVTHLETTKLMFKFNNWRARYNDHCLAAKKSAVGDQVKLPRSSIPKNLFHRDSGQGDMEVRGPVSSHTAATSHMRLLKHKFKLSWLNKKYSFSAVPATSEVPDTHKELVNTVLRTKRHRRMY